MLNLFFPLFLVVFLPKLFLRGNCTLASVLCVHWEWLMLQQWSLSWMIFVQHPMLDLSNRYTKDQLVEIARHFGIEVSKHVRKPEFKTELMSASTMMGVFPSKWVSLSEETLSGEGYIKLIFHKFSKAPKNSGSSHKKGSEMTPCEILQNSCEGRDKPPGREKVKFKINRTLHISTVHISTVHWLRKSWLLKRKRK